MRRQEKIESAVRRELKYSTEPIVLSVSGRRADPTGSTWSLTIANGTGKSPRSRSPLDESLEEAAVWWPGPPKGTARVLSVVPDESILNIRFASTPPPEDGPIRIYPPAFLDALADHWGDSERAGWSLAWLDDVLNSNTFDPDRAVPPSVFDGPLRDAQAAAFALPGWKMGFLWGPPGTGKTYTIGVMLASYLAVRPSSRILLLSTTNWAADLALLAVDDSLRRVGGRRTGEGPAGPRCTRYGSNYVAKNYVGREHLLPSIDEDVVRRMAELETRRPSPENVVEYDRWKTAMESLRRKGRRSVHEVLQRSNLVAMTTTGATFLLPELMQQAPFDLVVFDEASQVGRAQALALAPLGRSTIFAGDPYQLAPVVQSDHPEAVEWLGTSMFRHMRRTGDETCMLTEQSRMAAPICRLVSNVFYDGALTVAKDAMSRREWHAERELTETGALKAEAVEVVSLPEDGVWSRKYGGPVRLASANLICDLAESLEESTPRKEILVLTPFRAQRTLIRAALKRRGLRGVRVSTVHRAQGSECHTVIFDPAQGSNRWLATEEVRPLINVGLSRARARLVLLVSKDDRTNPLIQQICRAVEHGNHSHEDAEDVSIFARARDFPRNAVGKTVRIGRLIGRVLKVQTDCFILLDFPTGQEKRIKTRFVVEKYA